MEYLQYIRHNDKPLILNILRRTLAKIDYRLVLHGERVAYIAGKIADMDESLNIDRQKLLALCLLHDIGAYKTEEIDNMLEFETNTTLDHAAYGYVFLRNTTSLGDYAEVIRYHHTDYDQLEKIETSYKLLAELIFLADRVDVLLLTMFDPEWKHIRNLSGTVFSPELVDLFLAAEEKFQISAHIQNGSYIDEIDRQFNTITLDSRETFRYLEMLVYSIDFRSPFTVTHTANTASISGALADLFELSEVERENVWRGAFLHDIGKIATPQSILEKPGKLTDDEMAIMREHVLRSEEILSDVVSDVVLKIAVRHHEKMNGSGYPYGLTAKDLSLPERIVAVADILSALINRRSYKEPFPAEKSIAILEMMRDRGELCAEVCNMVITHFDEIMQFTDRSNDPVIQLYETIGKEYRDLVGQEL